MCLSLGQFAKMISLPYSNTVGVISVFVIIEIESAFFFNGFWFQVEIYHTFAIVFGLVFYHNEFFAIQFIAYSLANS